MTVGVRPEHIKLAEAGSPGALAADVVLTEHLGDQMLAYLRLTGVAEDVCMKLPGHGPRLRFGEPIQVAFPPEHCLLFDVAGNAYSRLSKQ